MFVKYIEFCIKNCVNTEISEFTQFLYNDYEYKINNNHFLRLLSEMKLNICNFNNIKSLFL